MIMNEKIVAVGKFQRTHALKGELNALLDIDPDYFAEGNAVIVDMDGIFVPFFVDGIRPKGASSYLVKLEGVDSDTDARQFVNKEIFADRDDLSDFMGEEFTMAEDLEGYQIVDEKLGFIGTLSHVDDSTDNTLFVVMTPDGEEILIPVVDDFIVEINDEDEEIVTSLPEGLVSLNLKSEADSADDD